VVGVDAVAAGNLLADLDALDATIREFGHDPEVPLAERLLAGLRAARDAGGEEGPVHSAGLIVVDDMAWPVTDLRVDWVESDPVGALEDLWCRWQPQEAAYRQRALDPEAAPGYGVPGDDLPGRMGP
jgi:uncharacterized Ntn-hydrolase superfamily protein